MDWMDKNFNYLGSLLDKATNSGRVFEKEFNVFKKAVEDFEGKGIECDNFRHWVIKLELMLKKQKEVFSRSRDFTGF
jgi:hypothetical protein